MPKPSTSRTVLSPSNVPMRMPLNFTLIIALVLDRFHAPLWVWTPFGMFIVFIWVCWLVDVNTRQNVDLETLLPPRK